MPRTQADHRTACHNSCVGGERNKGRDVLFAAITVVAVLFLLNGIVERLEDEGIVATYQADDAVQLVTGDLFDVEPEPMYVSSDYSVQTGMVPARFRVNKGSGWRVFAVGGSFMMGSPYTFQGHGAEMPGGITSWLRKDLERRGSKVPVEVVNLGVGGQNSFRVATIVEQLVDYAPDVVVVATCNNEGALPPSKMREQLQQLGGFRLLSKYLTPAPKPSERSYFTPQDEDSVALAASYRRNIKNIIGYAEAAKIPLVLSTLPVNRLYVGDTDSTPLIPDGSPRWGETVCVQEARALIEAGDFAGAITHLESCRDIPDALRWTGLAHKRDGAYPEARAALDQSIELQPRNRCRPSFNTIVREEAAASENTYLADLDEVAIASSESGLVGDELFLDFCHMNWRGYGLMATAIAEALADHGLLPRGADGAVEPLPYDDVARRWGLNKIEFVTD